MREKMLREQIQNRGISSHQVLRAMQEVPREKFVPKDMQRFAYEDGPVQIGYDQSVPAPYIVAYMAEVLELSFEDRILEIGTGSGYQAAVFSLLAHEVYTVDINRSLAQRAEKTLRNLRFDNIQVKVGDGYEGWKEMALFDAIVLTTAPFREIPPPLVAQLNDGGRILVPIGGEHRQKLSLFYKNGRHLEKRVLLSVHFESMLSGHGNRRDSRDHGGHGHNREGGGGYGSRDRVRNNNWPYKN